MQINEEEKYEKNQQNCSKKSAHFRFAQFKSFPNCSVLLTLFFWSFQSYTIEPIPSHNFWAVCWFSDLCSSFHLVIVIYCFFFSCSIQLEMVSPLNGRQFCPFPLRLNLPFFNDFEPLFAATCKLFHFKLIQ